MKKFYGKTVRIDGNKLKSDIKSLPKQMRNPEKISTNVLGRGRAYLHQSIHKGGMNKDSLDKLCNVFGFKAEDYILPDPEPIVVEEEPTPITETAAEKMVAEPITITPPSIDFTELTNAITGLTKVVNSLLTVQIATQKRIEELEKKLGSISTYMERTTEMVEVGLDSIDENIASLNSKVNIVNGRLGDMNRNQGVDLKMGA